MFAIKTGIHDPQAATYAFSEQKTMLGGKHIGEGSPIFILASENEGGTGLLAQGILTSVELTPMKRGINRQTPRVSITVERTALAEHALGRNELKGFCGWNDGRPETELNFKF